MREQVFEMKRKAAVMEDFESSQAVVDELGMPLDEFEATADKLYMELSEEDKDWVDSNLEEWYKEYAMFLGAKSCGAGGCSSCGGHHN